ncbi:MAG: DUF2852 domain-containing protein [Pseudomonadota bacterium]
MELVAKLDNWGKGAWITLMILGFIVFWPIGLAVLGFMLWSGRMGCWGRGNPGRWYYKPEKRSRGAHKRHGSRHHSSGNSAFDEYREETLRRLEDEQREFIDFLERLRHAKDKAEFDQFMSERKTRQENGSDTGSNDDGSPQGGNPGEGQRGDSNRRPPEGASPFPA